MTQNVSTLGGAVLLLPIFISMGLWMIVGVVYAALEAVKLFKYGATRFGLHAGCTISVLVLGAVLRVRAFCMNVPFAESLKGMGFISVLLDSYYCHYFANFHKLATETGMAVPEVWDDIMMKIFEEANIGTLSLAGAAVYFSVGALGIAVMVLTYGFLSFLLMFPFSWPVQIVYRILHPLPKEPDKEAMTRKIYEESDRRYKAAMNDILEQGHRQREALKEKENGRTHQTAN